MFRIRPAARLAITIGFLCLSLTFLALGINLIPDPKVAQQESRIALVRSILTSVTTLAESNRAAEIQTFIDRTVQIEPQIVSLGLQYGAKRLMVAGPHRDQGVEQGTIVDRQFVADIICNGRKWGALEIVFVSDSAGWSGLRYFDFPFPLVAFLSGSVTLFTWYTLSQTLRYLNPSRVVPDRVRSALDSIGSGLAMVTPEGEIAHANKAFNRIVQKEFEEVIGTGIDQYHWSLENDELTEFPWNRSRKDRQPVIGEIVQAKINSAVVQKFMVSATPIFAAAGQFRGVLVSFEDVTALEAKKTELAKIIQTVRQSRDEVQRQNDQLHFLANYDALTRCMNRRSFYTEFERLWAARLDHPLAVLLLDIDHFKKINDSHGHSAGDEVLKSVGGLLIRLVGNRGIVCRYGGEEFAILVSELSFEVCMELAEKIRSGIEKERIGKLKVTTSVGVSNRSFGASDGQHLVDQADQALYAAKRNGRNQVVSFDRLSELAAHPTFSPESPSVATEASHPSPSGGETQAGCASNSDREFEYASVTGLLSALSFRSRETAEHSIRVADLAVDIGRKLLTSRELYLLEISALLHDVGKIGVPDSILNKPGPLTDDEWNVMKRYDEMGLAIVRSAFPSTNITDTIEHYYQIKRHQRRSSHQIRGSLSSQILYVCDAFDSMISGSVYRKGMSVAQAMLEILKNTPSQFDSQVVNELMDFIQAGRMNTRRSVSHRQSSPDAELEISASPFAAMQNETPCPDQQIDQLIQLADQIMSLSHQVRTVVDPDCAEKP
jgi:diguanylate cyclase (GGDEF)-like protein/PAS domain S-box-containing protein